MVNVNIYTQELTEAVFNLLSGNVTIDGSVIPVYSFTTDVNDDYTILIHPIEANSGANCRNDRSFEYNLQLEVVTRFKQNAGSQKPDNLITAQVIGLIELEDFQVAAQVKTAIKVLQATVRQANSDGQYIYFRNIIRYNIQLTQ